MKIPETSANVGAYYGNEENGQWHPNGVMLDTGVGGGVVGSGDAGVHRPPIYPVPHPPAHHMPGYVMAGAYYPAGYPPPVPPDDFSDYMWMENEEEFDKQVMQQLEEEALMEQCIEAMLEDEHRERRRPCHKHYATTSNGTSLSLEETVSRSTLNPLAAEFVPTTTRAGPPSEDKTDSPKAIEQPVQERAIAMEKDEAREDTSSAIETKDTTDDGKVEESRAESPAPAPAEVSILKDTKRDAKKPAKPEPKKSKPQTTKSDTKVHPKKKEIKAVKSEVKVDEKIDDTPVETAKPQPSLAEEPAPSGPKPINYAAAARANKPKKPATHPVPVLAASPAPADKPKTEKPAQKLKDNPTNKTKSESKAKADKPVQRKNSTNKL